MPARPSPKSSPPTAYARHAALRGGPVAAYLGLDPGASGGLAVLGSDGRCEARPMPETPADLWDYFYGADLPPSGASFAVLEKVNGYVGDAGNPGSAMFKFGVGYGMLVMALTAAGLPYEEVTPAVWQRGLAIPPRKKGEGKTAWKNRLKAKAQALFPGQKVTLATADALLIAEFCRRKREGRL